MRDTLKAKILQYQRAHTDSSLVSATHEQLTRDVKALYGQNVAKYFGQTGALPLRVHKVLAFLYNSPFLMLIYILVSIGVGGICYALLPETIGVWRLIITSLAGGATYVLGSYLVETYIFPLKPVVL
ncbi:hypothetical protein ACIGB6_02020 [Paeniglutamicibacter gangotriensis]|uniref:Uncharacterized protein n=1 Tax=Paeniglutamicibacter gangotriensis TaxID=254787 RepID=A0A5B0E5N2_9MICC|nr:hypothetical protein [Paeniglutamicibacter gangotriensis]KAA0973405.1 hypothetical protein FQ154_18295 [Paeniglutamicibacter gangotriensis]